MISITIKIGITFIYRFHSCPIQLVRFFPIGLSLLLYHRPEVLVVEVSSVVRLGELDFKSLILQQPRPADDVTEITEGLQERTQPIETYI